MTVGCGLGILRVLSVGPFDGWWRFVYRLWEIGIWVIGILSGTLFLEALCARVEYMK